MTDLKKMGMQEFPLEDGTRILLHRRQAKRNYTVKELGDGNVELSGINGHHAPIRLQVPYEEFKAWLFEEEA